jgi:hypothetical protein
MGPHAARRTATAANRAEAQARAKEERPTEIVQNLNSYVRVRGVVIIAAKLARGAPRPPITSAEARVWMARPEGFEPPTY